MHTDHVITDVLVHSVNSTHCLIVISNSVLLINVYPQTFVFDVTPTTNMLSIQCWCKCHNFPLRFYFHTFYYLSIEQEPYAIWCQQHHHMIRRVVFHLLNSFQWCFFCSIYSYCTSASHPFHMLLFQKSRTCENIAHDKMLVGIMNRWQFWTKWHDYWAT